MKGILLFIYLKCFHCWKDGKIFVDGKNEKLENDEKNSFLQTIRVRRESSSSSSTKCQNDRYYCPQTIGRVTEKISYTGGPYMGRENKRANEKLWVFLTLGWLVVKYLHFSSLMFDQNFDS